uniref:Secreted protein n=1 Tax=Ixodes ricinus TaxID=34613 RepID=A0A6B0UHK2_IXORI
MLTLLSPLNFLSSLHSIVSCSLSYSDCRSNASVWSSLQSVSGRLGSAAASDRGNRVLRAAATSSVSSKARASSSLITSANDTAASGVVATFPQGQVGFGVIVISF